MAVLPAPGGQVDGQVRVSPPDLQWGAGSQARQSVVDQEVAAPVEAEPLKVDTRRQR
jgi:hypothetical protein